MELPEPDLTASASLQMQQQFYHMAVFMGCDSGEIEIGLSNTSTPAVADHAQQSLLEDLMHVTPMRPSSSSSSLPSLSIESPEYSSLIHSMATTVAAATEPSSQERQLLPLQPAVQLPGLLAPVYGHAPFPSAEATDAAMAQAILAVISSSAPPAPTTTATPPLSPPWLARHRAQRSSPRRGTGAFKAYNAALSPRARPRPRPGAPGQRMIKTALALMVSVHMATAQSRLYRELAAARQQEHVAAAKSEPPLPPQPTSSQLHHMISERRRRERLNESFQTLRALLPPGSKKDQATVLANATEYMNKLIAQVSNLEENNRRLEAELGLPGQTQQTESDDSSERVQVDVTTGASASTSTSDKPREVSIRVTVRVDCDLPELVIAMLARIKEMGRFAVVTVSARQRSSAHAQVSITLRVAAGEDELDQTSLKEAVAKVVEDAVTRPIAGAARVAVGWDPPRWSLSS
ncbi:putative transcription factor bHLH041 isoform X2 [Phragmites australis]|uniref:putative transcription factor bHLH041 isoform X2 n=1 Tax=Phragmites australis TaxID=29695 RepID=UPI002D785122|nr:putative transcription factor bHLH041 isoform X2 [Phragmites australis]XP_062229079.1 putative transcription factor bHLH041 isoform X2 [Phragmites australis]